MIVEDCEFSVGARAIDLSGVGSLGRIVETRFRNGSNGVHVSFGARAAIARSAFFNTGASVTVFNGAASPASATVVDSVISGGASGIQATTLANAAAVARVVVSNTTIEGSTDTALRVSSNIAGAVSTISISRSTISQAAAPWKVSQPAGTTATLISLGDNHFRDNGAPTGSLVTVLPQ